MNKIQKIIRSNAYKIPLLLSFIAVVISALSYHNSNEALKLSKQDFEASRKLILKSTSGIMESSFRLMPLDEEQKFQTAKVHSPDVIFNSTLSIKAPYFELELFGLKEQLRSYLDRYISQPDSGDFFEIPSGLFPIVIVSNYIAMGENRWDISLYHIEFTFRNYGFPKRASQLQFQTILYVRGLPKDIDYEKELNAYWKKQFNHLLKVIKKGS